MLALLHQPATAYGHPQPRWTLAALRTQPPLAGLTSVAGVCRRLHKWALPRKRSRDRLQSPDPQYGPKLWAIGAARLQAALTPHTHVFLYADEFTVYRQPEPGQAYWPRGRGGRHQPPAHRATTMNTQRRIAGALDAATGRVVAYQASTLKVDKLARFLRQVRQAYGPAVHLTLAWDNWPNHTHPMVREAAAAADIHVLFLPTYAPWTNPIEKVWAWLKDAVLRLHPWSTAWVELRARVTAWLAQFAQGSRPLLRYVGLLPDGEPTDVWY